MQCKICETRRPRRFCPAVRGDICAVCCGTYREETLDCPLDCVYLQEARKHDKPPAFDPKDVPNMDVRVSESFLDEHQELLVFAGRTLLVTVLETPGAVDSDIREALDALARTYRTMESGLIYETRPSNLVAASIQQRFQEALLQYQQEKRQQLGMETIRNAEILGVLVFFQRLEYTYNNGRKRGRAYLDFLRDNFSDGSAAAEPLGRMATGGSPLILG